MKLNLYTIRLCKFDEYEKLVEFFRKYWSEKHVFCRNKEIFEFQHGCGASRDGAFDFIVAVHNDTGEIHAVLGYISSSRYDGGDVKKPNAVYGALWKVREDIQNKEIRKLGLGVLYYLLKMFPDSAYITLGLSRFSQQIYDALHFNFGLMNHYYIAARHTIDFRIASAPVVNPKSRCSDDYYMRFLDVIPDGFDSFYYPGKNANYIAKRYMEHPFYKYKLAGIYRQEELLTVWVIREAMANGRKCLRIVDVVGDIRRVQNLEGNIHTLLKECDAEYIDCYNYGIDEEVFFGIGFYKVEGDTIIPDYFEPFEKKNIDIHYAFLSKKPVVIFKGDGDQDRPNLL